MVRVIYPLVNVSTKIQSEYYTMACYDLYIHNRIKYVRGEAIFFTDDLEDRPAYYNPINKIPKTIEESPFFKEWKFRYDKKYSPISSIDYIASVASYKMMTSK